MAERSGFEPENSYYTVTHLAGGRFRPLSHLSAGLIITSSVGLGADLVVFHHLNLDSKLFQAYGSAVVVSLYGISTVTPVYAHPNPIAITASATIILLGAAVAFEPTLELTSWKRLVAGVTAVMILGLTVESLGIYTGYPFGHYHYTDVWAPTILLPPGWWFPVQLPFAWVMLAGSCYLATSQLKPNWARPFAAACLAVAIDYAMEKVYSGLYGYWTWDQGSVPLMNYAGWFATAFAAALILSALKVRLKDITAPIVVLTLYMLLVLIQNMVWTNHQWDSGVVVCALLVTYLVANAWAKKRNRNCHSGGKPPGD